MERTGNRIQDKVALGALDGKHVALKKPKNSGALYHNYKGFFLIVMLALVDGQYKFRWVDVGTAESCSDAQIFNTCHLKRKIVDGSIGFPDPAPITQGGRDVPCFILADDAFALKTWLMKPYGRRMLTREEKIANYRMPRGRRVVENAFGILVSRFRVMLTTIELPPETVRDVVMTCVVLHNILRSQYQGQHGYGYVSIISFNSRDGVSVGLFYYRFKPIPWILSYKWADYWPYWEFIYFFLCGLLLLCVLPWVICFMFGVVWVLGFFWFCDKYLY